MTSFLAPGCKHVQHRGMKSFLALGLGLALLLLPDLARADDASHKAAAEALLNLMDMDKLMAKSVDQMLQMQVKQNPSIAPYEAQMKAFLNKYMSWASMKDDMVKIYVGEFTEPELKELTAFYKTPLGKKTVEKMPALMMKGAELSQNRIQAHMGELQSAIGEAQGAKKTP
jgi:hypothetical protein